MDKRGSGAVIHLSKTGIVSVNECFCIKIKYISQICNNEVEQLLQLIDFLTDSVSRTDFRISGFTSGVMFAVAI